MLARKPFLSVFFGLRKVRFQCYYNYFKFNKIVLVLNLLPTTFYIVVKTLVWIPFVEGSIKEIEMLLGRTFSQFMRITQSTFPMLLFSVQVQKDCSCAKTTSNDLLHHR